MRALSMRTRLAMGAVGFAFGAVALMLPSQADQPTVPIPQSPKEGTSHGR